MKNLIKSYFRLFINYFLHYMNIEHIAIPMDELELFKDEDVNQHYLV